MCLIYVLLYAPTNMWRSLLYVYTYPAILFQPPCPMPTVLPTLPKPCVSYLCMDLFLPPLPICVCLPSPKQDFRHFGRHGTVTGPFLCDRWEDIGMMCDALQAAQFTIHGKIYMFHSYGIYFPTIYLPFSPLSPNLPSPPFYSNNSLSPHLLSQYMLFGFFCPSSCLFSFMGHGL